MSSCAICLEPELNMPAACVPCGHTFCHVCITQWTRSPPRFGLSLCPQCRAPIREVQKLFISDWPASSGSNVAQVIPSPLSPWEQYRQVATLLLHFLSIPFHALASYGPEMVRRLTVWLNQLADRLMFLRTRLVHFAEICAREWKDLGLAAQCSVGVALLLVALLLLQDLQSEDGIHRGIVLPIFLVMADIIKLLCVAGSFIVYRPLTCFLACGLEVMLAAVDVAYVLLSSILMVAFDLLCIPWLVMCVIARVLCAVLATLASMVRMCMFCLVVALIIGAPTYLAAPNDEPLRAQISQLAHDLLEWLRRKILQHVPRDAERQRLAQRRRVRENILQDFLRLLTEELSNRGGEEGRGGEGGVQEGDGEVRLDEMEDAEEVLENLDEMWQNEIQALPDSLLHVGDTVEVW